MLKVGAHKNGIQCGQRGNVKMCEMFPNLAQDRVGFFSSRTALLRRFEVLINNDTQGLHLANSWEGFLVDMIGRFRVVIPEMDNLTFGFVEGKPIIGSP